MFFYCFLCISRTTGDKPASRPQHGADAVRIETDQYQEKFLHPETFLQCKFSESRRTRLSDKSIVFCGRTTRSRPVSIFALVRKLSRTSLFTMLRDTAFLSFSFDTARPSRECGSPFSLARTRNWLSDERARVLKTLWNSEGLLNR